MWLRAGNQTGSDAIDLAPLLLKLALQRGRIDAASSHGLERLLACADTGDLGGDARPSIEERYPSFAQYYSAVIRAIDDMVKDRLLLCEDADDQQARLLQAGLAAGVPVPHGQLPPQSQSPLCHAPPQAATAGQ